ncbi:MAG: SAM-dependent methyltransferase [Treponema sp.]|nr:SAM-dependent methyltransferase [Treponema sp.]
METALYLIPVTLGDTNYSRVLPEYNSEIIRGIRFFIVENIKSARRFLAQVENSHVDDAVYYELSEHTDVKDIGDYLDPIAKGESVGVISEAGCPAVADPGADIVAIAQKRNIRIVPLVGPSSMIMAVMASGLSGQSFAFNGYLPVKPAERSSRIRQLEQRALKERQTQLFIETPYRNAQMFDAIVSACRKETKLCVAAGITTDHEYIKTKTCAQWKKCGLPDLKKIPAIFLIGI